MTGMKEFLKSELGGKHPPFPGAPARMEIQLVNYSYVYCVARAIAFICESWGRNSSLFYNYNGVIKSVLVCKSSASMSLIPWFQDFSRYPNSLCTEESVGW